MTNLLEQFKNLQISRFEIVLQSQSEAVLPALIGSTLRGAFGYQFKSVSCKLDFTERGKCLIQKNCIYTKNCIYADVFEPKSKNNNLPSPYIFQPPTPPFTRDISENQTLKLRIAEKGKISFGLTLIGETVHKLPYFIYAFELMARHGLGVNRQSFSVSEVFGIDANSSKNSIYTPNLSKILPFQITSLAELVERRTSEITPDNSLRIRLQTPLRIRRNKELLENLSFTEFFKQCSLRLKFIAENYGSRLEYDYQTLAKQSENVKTASTNIWRHGFSRRSNRQDNKYDLDGLLGEIEFAAEKFTYFLPLIIACEFLHIGSASNLGLGRFRITD